MRLLFDTSSTSMMYKDENFYIDINGNSSELTYYEERSSDDDEECAELQALQNNDIDMAHSKNKLNLPYTTIGLFSRRGSEQLRPFRYGSPEPIRRRRAATAIPESPRTSQRIPPPDLALEGMSLLKLQKSGRADSSSPPDSPVSGPPSPDRDMNWSDSSSPIESLSPIPSPRTKRKTIDVTKSAAYKEIYAEKLRLYSVVLSKHMADTGEVGRQMNECRKARSKNAALKTDKASSNKNLLPPGRNRRSQSANCVLLQQQIAEWRSSTELLPPVERRNTISEADAGIARSRSMTFLQEAAIAEASSELNLAEECRVSCSDLRMQAAAERIQERRRTLESFDITLDETNSFLLKMRQHSLTQQA